MSCHLHLRCVILRWPSCSVADFFFFTAPASTEIYTLSLHDALPIYRAFARGELPARARRGSRLRLRLRRRHQPTARRRSEEHTSELQSPYDLVCRLLLEKKKQKEQTEKRAVLDHPQYAAADDVAVAE